MPLLRVRTKDGTERLQVELEATLFAVRQQIALQFKVPLEQQLLSRSVQAGIASRKGEAFGAADDQTTLASLGVANGDIIFLDYQMERENTAVSQAYAKDPFVNLVKEGELRSQGTAQWTLTNFLDYRSSKEFVLQAPPEPHCKFARVDARAMNALMNYMMLSGFRCKRVGYLYGRWIKDDGKGAGVQVDAIYEPAQDSTADDIKLLDDAEGEAKLAKVSAMLGLVRVGVVIAHPARDYSFTVDEVILASKLHAAALELDAEGAKHFLTMKARPVLDTEEGIEGVATVEAYQMTDQTIGLVGADAFSQSKTDPRVAKAAKDCVFLVEKKEQRKATMEHFIARVFDIADPFESTLSTGFAIENRPTDPQTTHRMGDYLRSRRGKESFLRTVADLHLLIFLSNLLDMNADMPVLCANICQDKGDELDGFQMMINCYAGID